MRRKKAICAAHGLIGVSPLDALGEEPAVWAPLPEWRRISLRNEAHIRSCALVIANLTPFRGPSADVGTVYELGFARGLGLPLFGYATVASPFLDRTLAATGANKAEDGSWRDEEDLIIEQFGLFDNLMIEGGIANAGGTLLLEDGDRWRDLEVFDRCAALSARHMRQLQADPVKK